MAIAATGPHVKQTLHLHRIKGKQVVRALVVRPGTQQPNPSLCPGKHGKPSCIPRGVSSILVKRNQTQRPGLIEPHGHLHMIAEDPLWNRSAGPRTPMPGNSAIHQKHPGHDESRGQLARAGSLGEMRDPWNRLLDLRRLLAQRIGFGSVSAQAQIDDIDRRLLFQILQHDVSRAELHGAHSQPVDLRKRHVRMSLSIPLWSQRHNGFRRTLWRPERDRSLLPVL